MTQFRIVKEYYEKKTGKYIIQKKNIFGWWDFCSSYEEFVDGKMVYHYFDTYETAEQYLLIKNCSWSQKITVSGNIYERREVNVSYPY